MDTANHLLGIGEFSRLTRLAPSALRYYDDADLLRPARVDAASGYRRYLRSQVPTAVLLRELRALAMPIAGVRAVLEASTLDAHRLLDDYWASAEASIVEARSRVAVAHRLIDVEEVSMGTVVTIEARTFRNAIRQVLPAAPQERIVRPGADHALPAGALLSVSGNILKLVATDGHRLASRELPAAAVDGGDTQRIVRGSALGALAKTLAESGELSLQIDDLAEEPGPFPPYETVLARAGRKHRLIGSVATLRSRLTASPKVVRLDGFEPPLTVGFDRDYLLAALDAAEGPEVIVETESPVEPALVRCPSDSSFTALVMPIRLKEMAAS